jgi:hypothetical protein
MVTLDSGMSLDTYYKSHVPRLCISLALGRIENDFTITLDQDDDNGIKRSSAWPRGVLIMRSPPP